MKKGRAAAVADGCHIKGKVPLNTSKDYASEVSSYTKGSVSYTHLPTAPTAKPAMENKEVKAENTAKPADPDDIYEMCIRDRI